MKIIRLAYTATDIENLHNYLKDALKYLEIESIGKSKTSLKKAIKKLEDIKPALKHPNKWVRHFKMDNEWGE